MALRGSAAVLALGLLGAWGTTRAEVTLREDTRHYTIRGATAAELRGEMDAKGPRGGDGRRYDGYTRWHVAWRYRYRTQGGQCFIDRVATTVDVTFTMPQWANEGFGSTELRRRWRQYLVALQQHENGHRRHGVEAAGEIDRGIAGLAPRASCESLGAAADALGHQVIRQYNQRDLDYDRTTDHGRTQGARFP